MGAYAYVWEFEVRRERLAEFERAYGPLGEWAQLFGRDPAYRGTDLLRDRADPLRFLTVDRWESRAACLGFRDRHRAEFDAVDARCAELTRRERELGEYDLVD